MRKPEMIAREQEKKLIEEGLDNLIKGDFSFTLVVGNSGVGKTFLISQVEQLFYENKCTYIKTKFTQHNQDLYTPATEILDEIVKQLLTLDQESFLLVQKTLKERLKKEENTIITLCPLASRIFGGESISPTLEGMNSDRIVQSMSAFIKEAASVLFPLVIFIDDVHWGDVISTKLVKSLCLGGKVSNFYLILALRENYNEELDRLVLAKDKIHLHEFAIEDVEKFIKRKWKLDKETLNTLGSLLYNLTKGNPFYLEFIARKISEENILLPGETYCELDMEKFSKMTLLEDIEDILQNEIRKISRDELELLQIISSFGNRISQEMVNAFYKERMDVLDQALKAVSRKSLLLKTRQNHKTFYSLSHDILHDALYKARKDQPTIGYYEIARVLVDGGFSKEYPMMISGFLLKASIDLLVADSTLWIDILHRGGKTSQERGSIKHALAIYGLCNKLVEIEGKVKKTKTYLDFQLAYLKCLFVNEKEEDADVLYHKLLGEFRLEEEVVKIKMVYIYCYAYKADWEHVLELGSEILRLLKYNLNLSAIPVNLLISRMIYSKNKIEKIAEAPTIIDRRILRIQEVLIVMFPAANRINEKMFNLINIKLAIIAGKYGNSPYSCVGYASYCFILFFVFGNYQMGSKLEKHTLKLLNDSDRPMYRSIAYALFGTFTYHWTNKFKDNLVCLAKSMEASEIEEEYLYTNYAFVFSIITMYVMGKPLKEIRQHITTNNLRDRRLENYLTYYMSVIYLAHIEGLENGTRYVEHLGGIEKESFSQTINLNADMIDIHRLYLEGKILDAYELAKTTDPLVKKHKGFILNGHYVLFSTLSRIAAHPFIADEEAELNHNIVRKQLKGLEKWADIYAPNHGPGYYIAQGEYNYYFNNSGEGSEDLYSQAIIIAQKEQNIQMEALANLLAARHSYSSDKVTSLHGKEAVRLYEKWGAYEIAGIIMEEFGLKQEMTIRPEPSEKVEQERKLIEDLSTIVSKNIEESYIYMLDYLIENHYCKDARILLEHNGEMNLRYHRKQDSKGIYYTKGIHINYIENIPHKMIRYSTRTEESVLIGEEEMESPLIRGFESLVEGGGFVLTAPLKNMGILTGILYMEKESEFEGDIIERVKFLYSLVDPENNVPPQKKEEEELGMEENLTTREQEILEQVGKGMSNSQISDTLFIAEGTVRNHLSKIYSKLNVESRVQAVISGKEKNII